MAESNLLQPNNLFALENLVITHLIDYNKKYALFTRCGDTGNPRQRNIDFVGEPCPTNKDSLRQDLIDAYDKLGNTNASASKPLGSIIQLKDAVNEMSSGPTSMNPQQYLQNYYMIMNAYEDIGKKRNTLDANLAELYGIGDTTSNFYQKKLISTSYTKILLTILATSLTVAAFMAMRKK